MGLYVVHEVAIHRSDNDEVRQIELLNISSFGAVARNNALSQN